MREIRNIRPKKKKETSMWKDVSTSTSTYFHRYSWYFVNTYKIHVQKFLFRPDAQENIVAKVYKIFLNGGGGALPFI